MIARKWFDYYLLYYSFYNFFSLTSILKSSIRYLQQFILNNADNKKSQNGSPKKSVDEFNSVSLYFL